MDNNYLFFQEKNSEIIGKTFSFYQI